VEVALLGRVEVRGAHGRLRRSKTLDLVAYLAVHPRHPRGVSSQAWATALWPDRVMAPGTLYSTVSVARRALGTDERGRDHLPCRRGWLALRDSVGTDLECFRRLAASSDPSDWGRAVDLVRGPPFDGLTTEWPVVEGHVAMAEEMVVTVGVRLAEHRLAHGDVAAAARAARRCLRASPYDERLFRILLRAADLQGNPAGVESVMTELTRVLGVEGPGAASGSAASHWASAVHPATADLYRRLSRRGGASGVMIGRL
jgi:DNA-binding SARP family transcriptional activator